MVVLVFQNLSAEKFQRSVYYEPMLIYFQNHEDFSTVPAFLENKNFIFVSSGHEKSVLRNEIF